jgi:hypothetical protein
MYPVPHPEAPCFTEFIQVWMGIAEREVSSHPVTKHNGINIYTLTVLANKEPRLTVPVPSDRYPLDGSLVEVPEPL